MSMLADVTEAAVALAEMQTQQENLLIAVDDVTVATSKSAGHRSPSSASMSVASTRRSTFRPET